MASWRNFHRDREGAVAVEFSAIAPLLIGLLVITLQLGISYYYSTVVQDGAFAIAEKIQSKHAPASLSAAITLFKSRPGLGSINPIISVGPINAASLTTTPTRSSYVLPAAGTPVSVTVVTTRPQFVPPGPLATIFPMLFSTNIVYTVVATP